MDYVILVVVLALIQYMGFGIMVGRARGKYGVSRGNLAMKVIEFNKDETLTE